MTVDTIGPSVFDAGLPTRRISNPRRTGPAPWKPFVGLSGPKSLPIVFDIDRRDSGAD